jgi:hypothetical protein
MVRVNRIASSIDVESLVPMVAIPRRGLTRHM